MIGTILKYYFVLSYIIVIITVYWLLYKAERLEQYKYLMDNKLTFFIMLSILLAFAPISLFIIIYSIIKEFVIKEG